MRAAVSSDPARAWALATAALAAHDAPDVVHAAADVCRVRGQLELAVRLDRTADDPSDTSRLAEAAAALARAGEVSAAVALLERALALAPFDAVLRSELAVTLARAGRPRESAAALALHPCLADDPGALFQFAWSSMLSGDTGAARECLPTLLAAHPPLAHMLEGALARCAIPFASSPPDLRDWLFVEHGALLLDRGARAGTHDAIDPNAPELVARLLGALRALGATPPRVIAAGENDVALASEIARALGCDAEPPPRAGIPAGLLVACTADALGPALEHLGGEGAVWTFAAVLPIADGAPVPDLVGAVARQITNGAVAVDRREEAALQRFIDPRRAFFTPRRPRAFVADAPLAWPPRL